MVQEWMWDEENVITGVSALPGHRLRIELRTGSVLELHMANRLDSARYYPLRDEELMRSVTTDGSYLRFGKGPDFAVQFSARMAVLMALNPPAHTVSGVNPFVPEQKAQPCRSASAEAAGSPPKGTADARFPAQNRPYENEGGI